LCDPRNEVNLVYQAAANWRISQKVVLISGVGIKHRVLNESVAGSSKAHRKRWALLSVFKT